MTWTQNGIDYVLQNFGDNDLCCVKTGLIYSEDSDPTQYSGGTPVVVALLATGLVNQITMVFPSRGVFTPTQLDQANGSSVSFDDADELTYHDEWGDTGGALTPVGQWCYLAGTGACCIGTVCSTTTQAACTGTFKGVGIPCTPDPCIANTGACCIGNNCSITTQTNCTGIFKGIGTVCTPNPCAQEACETHSDKTSCTTAGCHWYSILPPFLPPTCHATPEDPNTKYYIYGGIALIGIAAGILVLKKIRRQ